MLNGQANKKEQEKEKDKQILRTALLLFGGIAAFVMLVLLITVLTHSSKPASTPAYSAKVVDPYTLLETGDFNASSLSLIFAGLTRRQVSGEKLTALNPPQIAKIYSKYISASEGFEYAAAILKLFSAMPKAEKVWRDFLDARIKEGDRIEPVKCAAWLSAFAEKELGNISVFDTLLTTFFNSIAVQIDRPAKKANALRAAHGLMSVSLAHSGKRGDAPRFCASAIRFFAAFDEGTKLVALQFFSRFLEVEKAGQLHSVLGDTNASDNLFIAAANAFGRIGAESSVQIILSTMTTRSQGVQAAALKSVELNPLEKHFAVLWRYATNEDTTLAVAAISAMTTRPDNCGIFASELSKYTSRFQPSVIDSAIRALKNCPDDKLPTSLLLTLGLRGEEALNAVKESFYDRTFGFVLTSFSGKIHPKSLAVSSTKNETQVLIEIMKTCANAQSGAIALEAYDEEMRGAMNTERCLFLVEIIHASYKKTRNPELLSKLKAIASESPDDRIRAKAASLLRGN